jgi:hypothetical protein
MVNKEITIVYYTDNSLKKEIDNLCKKNILNIGGKLISVSQKPIQFGKNICVGDIGKSHLSLFRQILAGVEQVTTKYVALAEHDIVYHEEHFNWVPPKDDIFYYNVNHWLVDWNTGMYSYARRKVLSMMVANTALTLQAARDKIKMLSAGALIRKGKAGACEFGVCDNREAFTDELNAIKNIRKDFGKDINQYHAVSFKTNICNLDIRHDNNFSGGKRGKYRRYELPYWGKFSEVVNA